jgi:hypothetical protein
VGNHVESREFTTLNTGIKLHQVVQLKSCIGAIERLQPQSNLLINDLVEWFSTRQTPDGNTHQFGIGVVMNADKPAVVGDEKPHENLPIVFVLSTMSTQAGPVRNLTVHAIKDFRALPEILSTQSKRKSDLDLGELIREVTPLVDQAYAAYLRGRIRAVPNLKHVR